ncbi:hypothetical protein B6N60_04677 [Richelia sinica FACHB-800]|uniref:Uncharacterized protein n=1 Tax=Richelia sinica FACHB-800 TaxID=1357546 RepID=A0A975TCJ8_9NOST|nr:hypothetical protein B6N60_04677 [Richelia sinica FACHB-800]
MGTPGTEIGAEFTEVSTSETIGSTIGKSGNFDPIC